MNSFLQNSQPSNQNQITYVHIRIWLEIVFLSHSYTFRPRFVIIKEFIHLIKNRQSSQIPYVTFSVTLLFYTETTQHNIYFISCTGIRIFIAYWNTTYAIRRVCILITECLFKLQYIQTLRRDVQRQNYDTFSHGACSSHITNTDLKYCMGNGKGKGRPMTYSFGYWGKAEVYLQPIRKSALEGDRLSTSFSSRPNPGKDRVPIVQEAVGTRGRSGRHRKCRFYLIRSAERPSGDIVDVRAIYLSTEPRV